MTQRVLAQHQEVATASEPWLLLPLLHWRFDDRVYSTFGFDTARQAYDELDRRLTRVGADLDHELCQAARGVYEALSNGRRIFLDKTPRYSLVAGSLLRSFPEALFVVVWRNPLSVIASLISTFGAGRWNLYRFEVDLYEGLQGLLDLARTGDSRVCCVRYEDLVTGDREEWLRLFEFLGLEYRKEFLSGFGGGEVDGPLGDKTGNTVDLDQGSSDKWRGMICNPLRKRYCVNYLKWIGPVHLQEMGYELDKILSELSGHRVGTKYLLDDLFRSLRARVFLRIQEIVVRRSLRPSPRWRWLS